MKDRTKRDLEVSLKHLLLKKPLTKITIQELADDCGISRMTFYYHFKDIYDLVEWACIEDARVALQGKKTYSTWQEGLLQIFEAVYENKPFIMNAYRSVDRERMENFLFHVTSQLIRGVVTEQAGDQVVPEEKLQFIADFYTYSFVGVMLSWIGRGMKDDYGQIVQDVAAVMKGNIGNSIRNFAR